LVVLLPELFEIQRRRGEESRGDVDGDLVA